MSERRLTRRRLAAAISGLPPKLQDRAIQLAQTAYPHVEGRRTSAKRSHLERRRYAGRPDLYIREVLGFSTITDDQYRVLEAFQKHDWILVPAANNVGKTWLLGCLTLYVHDALAALPDEDRNLPEQGAQILLPGPDHLTIFDTIYSTVLEMANLAEARGFGMPRGRSEASVLWRVRPRWMIRAFSPPRSVGRRVEARVSGRHHRNQVAIIEEGQQVPEPVWTAAEGMCSSAGNKIISAFNPTEPIGPAHQRAQKSRYHVVEVSALDHPNVKRRSYVVPDAIDYLVVDGRVRSDCTEVGPYPQTRPDEIRGDLVYALPDPGAPERGPREDGIPGHPDVESKVFRPSPVFEAQVLGRYPKTGGMGLFDPGAWDAGVERWLATDNPPEPPWRVGVDAARSSDGDEITAAPAWGEGIETLLRDHRQAEIEGNQEALQVLLQARRLRVGTIAVVPPGSGPEVARWLEEEHRDSTINIDESTVGASVYDHAREVLGMDVVPVNFAGRPYAEIRGLPIVENMRALMYVWAARGVWLGLVDPPPDPMLREEILAHAISMKVRTVPPLRTGMKAEKKLVATLHKKDDVKAEIGRSPDRADAFCMSLLELETKTGDTGWI